MKHSIYLIFLLSFTCFAMDKPLTTEQIEKEFLRVTLCDRLQTEEQHYASFIRWKYATSSGAKLAELKLKFAAMAAVNNVEAMKAIEALVLDWQLIDNPDQKLEKLDYYGALARAAQSHAEESITYLLNKKNITLKNQSLKLLKYICNGQCKRSYCTEVTQKNILQLMIKKKAPSTVEDLKKLIEYARSTKAPERLIHYLEEVETSRRNS